MSVKKIVIILTCFNRKEKTMQCIRSLQEHNNGCIFTFVVVDDGSTDGTLAEIREYTAYCDIKLLTGDGSLFYSGGMRKGMEYVKEALPFVYDYVMLVNDDVDFLPHCIENLISQSEQQKAVIVGATKDTGNQQSYGAIKYTKGIKYHTIPISQWQTNADTFNANCVLIPHEIFSAVEIMDFHYVHSMGDFDYGLSIHRAGFSIYSSKNYVGICEPNSSDNTWNDTNLSICERIRKKESPKGLPSKQWYYYLKKNFGLFYGIKGVITPYIRIFLGK